MMHSACNVCDVLSQGLFRGRGGGQRGLDLPPPPTLKLAFTTFDMSLPSPFGFIFSLPHPLDLALEPEINTVS